MEEKVEVLVSGGGPAGAAAALRAASLGATVVVCDKATFPRDKPCGDGLTPRSVRLLQDIGLGDRVATTFHRVDQVRIVGERGAFVRSWPARKGLPDHGYVAERTVLDSMILEQAGKAGATVRQGWTVHEPIVEDGVVRGAVVRTDDGVERRITADVTIAADGMTSRLGRSVGMVPSPSSPFAVAVRAQVDTERPDDGTLECYVNLMHAEHLLPGYGWVFPMGGGRVNIGMGYISTYKRYKEVHAHGLMDAFVRSLPPEWRVPPVAEMVRSRRLNGWRLPMALGVWPPWRPGLMAAGDAVAAGKPFTGSGISKALESGRLAADTALEALGNGDPADLSAYEHALRDQWGAYYRLGRYFVSALGRPAIMRQVMNVGLRFNIVADALRSIATSDGAAVAHAPKAVDRITDGAVKVAGRFREKPSVDVGPVEVRTAATRLRER